MQNVQKTQTLYNNDKNNGKSVLENKNDITYKCSSFIFFSIITKSLYVAQNVVLNVPCTHWRYNYNTTAI